MPEVVDSRVTVRPRHVAVIMDGNGRWARKRGLPRHAGHRAGIRPLRTMVEECASCGIDVLTAFAFSSENWGRPDDEVSRLMRLFLEALDREVAALHENGVRLSFIGDRSRLLRALQEQMARAEALTAENAGLRLVIAVAYGGRWEIVEAARRVAARVQAGELDVERLTTDQYGGFLQTADLPDPDLMIRTGGEHRISNFLIWQLAYCELHFTDVLWPDFGREHLHEAFRQFAMRQRRFGRTGAQTGGAPGAS